MHERLLHRRLEAEIFKKKLIKNEYWVSIDSRAQNLILHNQSQTKRCENMFDMQAGKTDANK